MRTACLAAVFALATGCMAPASPAQRLSDSAYDVSSAMRFGRMDIATEHVAADARAEFARKHAAWGRSVRIVDVELADLRLRDKDNADVVLQVSWQRANEADVRWTAVSQTWHDDRGWRLVKVERSAGDHGLLADDTQPSGAAAPAPGSRFATRVIAGE
jgi:hypothetical protein